MNFEQARFVFSLQRRYCRCNGSSTSQNRHIGCFIPPTGNEARGGIQADAPFLSALQIRLQVINISFTEMNLSLLFLLFFPRSKVGAIFIVWKSITSGWPITRFYRCIHLLITFHCLLQPLWQITHDALWFMTSVQRLTANWRYAKAKPAPSSRHYSWRGNINEGQLHRHFAHTRYITEAV